MDSRVVANQLVTVFVGPDSGITNWQAPTLAEVTALTNVSAAVNWDAFDLNLQASDTADDRTLADAAGAKSRSTTNFGGNLEFVLPKPADTSSIYRIAYNIFKGDRTKLAIVVRVGKNYALAPAAGDVINAYHVLEDSHTLVRATQNKPSYAYKVNVTPQDDVAVNAIIPSATATAVAITPSATATADVDGTVMFKAVYESVNVTIGADWVSSDPDVLLVTPHGIGIAISAGTASVTASYAGSAAGTPTVVTVS